MGTGPGLYLVNPNPADPDATFTFLGVPKIYAWAVLWFFVQAAVYVMGSRIARLGRAKGYVTPADMVADYYDNSTAIRVLVALLGFLYVVPYVVMQIRADEHRRLQSPRTQRRNHTRRLRPASYDPRRASENGPGSAGS